jgi:hypothetical protein
MIKIEELFNNNTIIRSIVEYLYYHMEVLCRKNKGNG